MRSPRTLAEPRLNDLLDVIEAIKPYQLGRVSSPSQLSGWVNNPACRWLNQDLNYQHALSRVRKLKAQPPNAEQVFLVHVVFYVTMCQLEKRSNKKSITRRDRQAAIGHAKNLMRDFKRGIRLGNGLLQMDLDRLLAAFVEQQQTIGRKYSGPRMHGIGALLGLAIDIFRDFHDCPPALLDDIASITESDRDPKVMRKQIASAKRYLRSVERSFQ